MMTLIQQRALVALAAAGLAAAAAQADSGARNPHWTWTEATRVVDAVPPLPPPETFPVQLVVDDDSAEGSFGVATQTARQFLWFNRFSPAAGFHLEEVWVLFPAGANMAAGGAVQIAIYADPDGDPSNGATLLQSFDTTIQAADGNTFSIYPLPTSELIETGSDLLVGVVPRFIVSGATSATTPAALDTSSSQSRSWIAIWSSDPPDPPALVPLPDQAYLLVDGLVPGGGNWMIRAFGSEQGITEIPTLGEWGLVALALALLGAGVVLLRRRGRDGAGATLALVLLASAAPAGAVTIDTFTTNQAVLTDPAGGNSTATGGADILGTRRGMVIDLLSGAGPTTASVAGGNLSLAVTATTPDSRGEVRLSWDADLTPLVLSPTGLANANLTTANASGFRFAFASTTVASEIEITVYDSATDFSRAGRRIPVSGAPFEVLIPFAEFRVAGGSGADFASVGAIELTVRSGEGTVALDEITTTAPTVAGTKVDAQIVDTDSDTRVDPGDRVRYTVTVTNTGNEALAVDLADTVDANTTLVAGSVSSTPLAHNDQYGWFGNVAFATDGSSAKPYLLDNDEDADGDTLTVQAGTFPATSAQGGTLTLVSAATGEFTYSPPAGYAGVDSFSYTILDDNGNTSTATASIILEGVIWFVDDSNTTAPFLGTLADPFQTLASVNSGSDPDQPGDTIFVFDDNGTPYAGGLVLEADQTLLGEAAGLVLDGTTIVPFGGRPQITNAAGIGILLSTDNTLAGLDVQGTSGTGIVGLSFGTLTASDVNVLSAGNALALQTGNLAASFGTLSSAGTTAGRGVGLTGVTGSLTATTTTVTNPTTDGILVTTSPGVSLNFGTTTITDNAIGSGPTGNGVHLNTSAGASVTFASLAVTSDGGTGLFANASGTINIGGTGSTINSTSGPAVDVTSTSFGSGVTFATLSSTNSTGKGVNLDTITGSFTGNGGSISNPTGVAFDLNAGASNVTYAGPVSKTSAGNLIEVTSRTGGTVNFSGALSSTGSSNGIDVIDNNVSGSPIIQFSGSSKVLNTGSSTAVQLTNNDVATIHFTGGGLDIDTTAGNGFSAYDGAAAITVEGTGNTILANGAGTALEVTNSNIGAAGLNFQSISAGTVAGTAGLGISLNGTGTGAGNGGLTVSGTGSAGSGGTIRNKTGANGSTTAGIGIYLNSTKSPSFNWMQLNDFQNFGIRGHSVAGFTLTNTTINSASKNGDDAATDESSIYFGTEGVGGINGLTGAVTITNCLIEDGFENNFKIANRSGTVSQFTMTGTTIRDTSVASPGNNGLEFRLEGTASLTADITNSTFTGNRANGIQLTATPDWTGTADLEVGATGVPGSGGTFTNNNIGVNIANGGIGTMNFDVQRGTFNSSPGLASPININLAAGGGGPLSGSVVSNVITNANSGTGPGIRVTSNGTDGDGSNVLTVLIEANNVSQVGNRGVEVIARDGNSRINATIANNVISLTDPLSADGIRADAGTTSTDTTTVCADIRGNTSTTVVGVFGIRVRQRFAGTTYILEDYAGGALDDTAVQTFLSTNNGGATTSADHAGTGFGTIAECPMP